MLLTDLSGCSELGAWRCNPGWHGPGSAGTGPSYAAALIVAVTKPEHDPADVPACVSRSGSARAAPTTRPAGPRVT